MVLNFAHRGSLTEAPENTLPAIEKAIEHGAQAIELDVQLTKDQELIVIHDHKLTRFHHEHRGLVKDYTLAELKQIDVGSKFSSRYKGVTLAALSDILTFCPKDVLLNIEIKNIPVIYDEIEEKLLHCLRKHHRLENIIISSFDHLALKKIQQLNPDIPIGLLFYYRILEPWNYTKHCGLDIYSIHPHVSFTDEKLIAECHKQGYNVFPFTVNDEKTYRQLLECGVDGVFSNNPDIFGN